MRFLLLASVLALPAFAQLQPGIEVLHVRDNIYMFASDGGNVTVQVGEHRDNDGVLMVDTGSAQTAGPILVELQKLTAKQLKYVVNTSADLDHAGGNDIISSTGGTRTAEGRGPLAAEVNIYAQDNALTRLSAPEMHIPEKGLPTMTFERLKDFTFNGEAVQIFSEAPAHTDGDSIVFFRGSNVISTGEIFSTVGYPVIDLARGGSIQGEVKALNHLLELTVPEISQEGGTMVIPGHGRLCDEADVTEYRDMVTILRDRVADLIEKGKSLAEVKAARLTRDYDGRYSQPTWTGDMFVESVYKSLKPAASQGSR
jgi:glyoxylase-like metal-dependent hydrolase (beta-lactamase superfamily II)